MISHEKVFERVETNACGVPIRIVSGKEAKHIGCGKRVSRLHFHDEIEIITVLEGKMRFDFADGCSYCVENGQTICIGTRVPHETFCESEYMLNRMIQFRPYFFEGEKSDGFWKYISSFSEVGKRHVFVTDSSELRSSVETICREYDQTLEGSDLYITANVYAILGFLHRRGFLSSGEKADDTKLKRLIPVFEYIDGNYNSDIKLSEVSAILGVSEYHFCRLWKSAVGSSFVDYLNFVRVSKADKLLRKTDASVLDIAFETGFSSLSYFNRIFKKFKNCSPTVYRKASKDIFVNGFAAG